MTFMVTLEEPKEWFIYSRKAHSTFTGSNVNSMNYMFQAENNKEPSPPDVSTWLEQ